jgi:predicted transcriptional regulator
MTMPFEHRLLKRNKYRSEAAVTDVFLLFARSTPWMIIDLLRHKEKALSEISESLKIAKNKVFSELVALQKKDMLVSFNRSQETFYRLSDDRFLQAFDLIHKISQRKIGQAKNKSSATQGKRSL